MKKLNVQMYSLGHDNNDPFIKSFETLASFGYTGVEFAGSNYDGLSVEDMKAALANAGLEAVSSHVQLAKMEEDIPYMAALGAKMIICPMHAFKGVDEAKRFAEMLNKYGKIAAEYGMKVGYHNHTQEFWPTEGKPVLDYVIENTDPALVGFQLDCGWCSCAGINPVDDINKFPGRFMAIHVKENNRAMGPEEPHSMDEPNGGRPPMKFDENGKPIFPPEFLAKMEERNKLNCATGEGIVDWKAVKAAADAQSTTGDILYIVEREANYGGLDRLTCLKADAAWCLANL